MTTGKEYVHAPQSLIYPCSPYIARSRIDGRLSILDKIERAHRRDEPPFRHRPASKVPADLKGFHLEEFSLTNRNMN